MNNLQKMRVKIIPTMLAMSAALLLPTFASAGKDPGLFGFGSSTSVTVGGLPLAPSVLIFQLSILQSTDITSGLISDNFMIGPASTEPKPVLNLLGLAASNATCLSIGADNFISPISPLSAWFSGQDMFVTPDPRLTVASNQQTALLTQKGEEIILARMDSIDGSGLVNQRSLFSTGNTVPVVSLIDKTDQTNATTAANTAGSVSIAFYGQGNGSTFCKKKDRAFNQNVNYWQLTTYNGSTACCYGDKAGCSYKFNADGSSATAKLNGKSVPLCDIQWVKPDFSTPTRLIQHNTIQTFSARNVKNVINRFQNAYNLNVLGTVTLDPTSDVQIVQ